MRHARTPNLGVGGAGHLVTLDDEAAGGWSSRGGSSQVRSQSLGELAVKILVALLVAWLVVGAPLAHHAA